MVQRLTVVEELPKVHKTNWNVIEESDFRGRVRTIFSQVADMLTNTLGPYGSNTIIEKFGEMHITKDGWQILKKIAFDDATDNNVLQLLINISAQVVIKVGDGSTSSIVAARQVLDALEASEELKKIRPKEVMDLLAQATQIIADHILDVATKINPEEDPGLEQIYRLAMISTNGDTKIAEIIQSIYTATGNPFIEFTKSKSAKTDYEIIEGYQAPVTYLDAIYATQDDGSCVVRNPLMLMFDHKIDKDYHLPIIEVAVAEALKQQRRLVVIAPHYDNFLLNHIRQVANSEYRAMGTTTVVYNRVSLINAMFQEYYNDFSIMTGGIVINENNIDELNEDKTKVTEYLGTVDEMTIGGLHSTIKGFHNRNQQMYEIALRDAHAKYKKLEETHHELNIVDAQLYELKKRISKLSGVMGVIRVGGASTLEKTSNYDLVEDAVKACESAYNYGYNLGGNLVIPITIEKELLPKYEENQQLHMVLNLLSSAFRNVFIQVLRNKYRDEDVSTLQSIVSNSIDREKCYDLIQSRFSDDVINPCFTDIEILKATTSIVSLLLSSNQYVSIRVNKDED